MYVFRSAAAISVRAPAKLNLFFEVLGKRGDGFHEIETLMVPIALYDSLSFQPEPAGQVRLNCRWASRCRHEGGVPLGDLPPEAENLAIRAVVLLRERAGVRAGASIELVKRIPTAAGLGGGSSDAAAALWAANLGWRLNWSRQRVADLAAELGSDVPFFLGHGLAICRGRGEQIEPIDGAVALHFVVVRPPAGLATATVYRNCHPARAPRSVRPLVDALLQGNLGGVSRLLHNQLQPAAESLSPWVARLRDEFARLDCVAAQMSGSGTSYFGICRHARHAQRVAGQLKSRNLGRVYVVRSSG